MSQSSTSLSEFAFLILPLLDAFKADRIAPTRETGGPRCRSSQPACQKTATLIASALRFPARRRPRIGVKFPATILRTGEKFCHERSICCEDLLNPAKIRAKTLNEPPNTIVSCEDVWSAAVAKYQPQSAWGCGSAALRVSAVQLPADAEAI